MFVCVRVIVFYGISVFLFPLPKMRRVWIGVFIGPGWALLLAEERLGGKESVGRTNIADGD